MEFKMAANENALTQPKFELGITDIIHNVFQGLHSWGPDASYQWSEINYNVFGNMAILILSFMKLQV